MKVLLDVVTGVGVAVLRGVLMEVGIADTIAEVIGRAIEELSGANTGRLVGKVPEHAGRVPVG